MLPSSNQLDIGEILNSSANLVSNMNLGDEQFDSFSDEFYYNIDVDSAEDSVTSELGEF